MTRVKCLLYYFGFVLEVVRRQKYNGYGTNFFDELQTNLGFFLVGVY